MKLLLKFLAPWFAVGICWCVFKNGWLAILAYHAQVLLWELPRLKVGKSKVKGQHPSPILKTLDLQTFDILAALPTIIAGPLVYFLLPYITHTDISTWLIEYKLTGSSLLLMVPYFGIVHPMLEQLHWNPLRKQTPLAHLFFAGYHMLVLSSLVTIPWLAFCFAALAAASFTWKWLTQKSNSLFPATLSHILADLGIILAATVAVSV